MSVPTNNKVTKPINKSRLVIGGSIFISGFLSPLLVPLVTNTEWSIPLKTTLSGLLIFGIPELFMIIAIAITGKDGFNLLKNSIFRFFRSFLATNVSKTQYTIGLFMFFSPLAFGILYPYIDNFILLSHKHEIIASIILDSTMLFGVFILGVDFWEKLQALFIFKKKASNELLNLNESN